jgi:hypothetical protein
VDLQVWADKSGLDRGADMPAGHLSREFRLAYGESPYGYLMTRRMMPSCVAEQVTRPVRNREAPATERQLA